MFELAAAPGIGLPESPNITSHPTGWLKLTVLCQRKPHPCHLVPPRLAVSGWEVLHGSHAQGPPRYAADHQARPASVEAQASFGKSVSTLSKQHLLGRKASSYLVPL